MSKGKYARRRAARGGTPGITVHEVTDDELAAASPEYAAILAARSCVQPDFGDIAEDQSPDEIAVQVEAAYERAETAQRAKLEGQQMGPLRDIARSLDLKPGRVRKAELIDLILTRQFTRSEGEDGAE